MNINSNADSVARILAMAALDAAQSGGGGGGKGIDSVYILDGHLHIVYSTGDDMDVGQVVGAPGKDGAVYKPSIIITEEGYKVLHWEIVEKPEEVPEDVIIGKETAIWTPEEPDEHDKYSDYKWDDISDDDQAVNEKASNDFIWDEI